MPLLSSLDLAGDNVATVNDLLVRDSQILALSAAAGAEINTGVDFREQVMTVVSDTTDIVPIGEGVDQTDADATVTNPKYDVHMWPAWRPVTEQTQRNTSPLRLAQDQVNALAPRFPISIDKYYMNLIIAGASVTEVVFNPAQGVDSLKSILAEFTSTSYQADWFAMTRLGTNELGWNKDGDNRRMNLTEATGVRVGETGAVLADKGANRVLGLIGPFGQSSAGIAAGLEMQVFPQVTKDGKGPGNGWVQHRAMMALGWGNAQATNNDKTIDGAGFVVVTLA